MKRDNDLLEFERVEAPILFLIFNRPDKTRQIFNVIRKTQPKQLFIAADGPRSGRSGEAEKCDEARTIVKEIDWPCEVHTLFRNENLGCGMAVSSAISWFFEHVEEGIILEDDTLPGPGFFRFCTEMLTKYRDDTRVMSVSGLCLPCKNCAESEYSYFFSNWDYMWGWATWRRAWMHYDYKMKSYPHIDNHHYFDGQYYSRNMKYFIQHMYDRSYYENDSITWWSYQWGFARKINSGVVIVPNKNMVTNIGFGSESTNTSDGRYELFELETMKFPLTHPPFMMIDRLRDDQIFRENVTPTGTSLKSFIKEMLPVSLLKKRRFKKIKI